MSKKRTYYYLIRHQDDWMGGTRDDQPTSGPHLRLEFLELDRESFEEEWRLPGEKPFEVWEVDVIEVATWQKLNINRILDETIEAIDDAKPEDFFSEGDKNYKGDAQSLYPLKS